MDIGAAECRFTDFDWLDEQDIAATRLGRSRIHEGVEQERAEAAERGRLTLEVFSARSATSCRKSDQIAFLLLLRRFQGLIRDQVLGSVRK